MNVKTIKSADAIAKIDAALAGGCEEDWKPQVEAVIAYFNSVSGIGRFWAAEDLICVVNTKTGVRIDRELSSAIMDIITE